MAVVVGHDANKLLAGERNRASRSDSRRLRLGRRARRGLFLRRRAARRRLLRRGLLEWFGLLADRRLSGRRLLAFDFGFRFSLCGGHGALPGGVRVVNPSRLDRTYQRGPLFPSGEGPGVGFEAASIPASARWSSRSSAKAAAPS